MTGLGHDLRLAGRMLRAHPGISLAACLTLALGLGAGTAVFSVVHALLVRPLPWPGSDRMVWIYETNLANGITTEPASLPNLADWRSQAASFEELGGMARWQPTLTTGGEPERIPGAVATAGLLRALGARPALGRLLGEEDEVPGAARVVVVSDALWRGRLGADPAAVGREILLNGNGWSVVGVLPPEFESPRPEGSAPIDAWIPARRVGGAAHRRSDSFGVIGRLVPGATLSKVRAEMETIAARLAAQYPDTNTGWSVRVIPLRERLSGSLRPSLLVLAGGVAFLMLIACANVSNLLMARLSSRRREMGIRAALGASRARLIRQLLVESCALALAGGLLGLLAAGWGIDLVTALGPPELRSAGPVEMSLPVLLFGFTASLLSGILFGTMPAVQAGSGDPQRSLAAWESRAVASSAGSSGMRRILVAAQTALALILLAGAGLMARTLWHLQRLDTGFQPRGVVTARLGLPPAAYRDEMAVDFFQRLIERAASLPSVEEAGAVSYLPLEGGNFAAFRVQGRPPVPDGVVVDAILASATPGYFGAMKIPLRRGRLFTPADGAGGEPVALVSEAAARRHWPGEDPIGARISTQEEGPGALVIGIVGDTLNDGLQLPSYPQIYRPLAQAPDSFMTLVVRSAGPADALAAPLRAEIRSLDAGLPVPQVRDLQQVLDAATASQRFSTTLLSLFSGIALSLAAVGIYGVISFAVGQRTREIGIRMALGAGPGDVIRMVLRQGMAPVLAGVAAGLSAAVILTRFMSGMLFGVSPTDPATFAAIAGILSLVALAACWLPARRAVRVNPSIALRSE